MEQDPSILAAAEACRNLQECHRLYGRAERIAHVRPEVAKGYYRQILARAPSDSEVYKAAREKYDAL